MFAISCKCFSLICFHASVSGFHCSIRAFSNVICLHHFFLSIFFLHFTEPSPLYDNNHYHEECLRCNSCGINLSGPNHKRARRFKNQILCDLHFADVALMECSDFMQQLRSFKPQSLGCAVARRKSSTTLIFPLPPQACSGNNLPVKSLANLILFVHQF